MPFRGRNLPTSKSPIKIRRDAPTYLRDHKRLSKTLASLDAEIDDACAEISAACIRIRAGGKIDQEGHHGALGVAIPSFSHRIWKKRSGSTDQSRGRSGGLRIIYELNRTDYVVTLLLIFGKSEKADVTDHEVSEARKRAGLPL